MIRTKTRMRSRGPDPAVEVAITDTDRPQLTATLTYASGGLRMTEVRLSLAGAGPGEVTDLELTAGAAIGRLARDPGFDTAIDLRQLPWARWERAARAAVADLHTPRKAKRPRSGDEGREARLERVAAEYRANLRSGVADPAAAIAREHGAAPQTVRVWLMEARRLGILGPARSRTAGEAALPPRADADARSKARGAQTKRGRRP